MNISNQHNRFEVTDHYELKSRGAFVIGHIVEGAIGVGMLAKTRMDSSTLTIRGVEFLDNISARKFWNALVFAERPSLEFIKRAFPVGSFIEVVSVEGSKLTT